MATKKIFFNGDKIKHSDLEAFLKVAFVSFHVVSLKGGINAILQYYILLFWKSIFYFFARLVVEITRGTFRILTFRTFTVLL